MIVICLHLSKLGHLPFLTLLLTFLTIITAAGTMHLSHLLKSLPNSITDGLRYDFEINTNSRPENVWSMPINWYVIVMKHTN